MSGGVQQKMNGAMRSQIALEITRRLQL